VKQVPVCSTSADQRKRSAAIALETIRRARRRRRERGALFIEAMVVFLMTAGFLAGVIFFHGVYRAKAETLQEARQLAWLPALSGCKLRSPEVLGVALPGQSTRIARGFGVFPDDMTASTKTTVTCNEVSQRGDVTLAQALDTLRALVSWKPIDMARWFFGSSLPFAETSDPLRFVGRWVSLASDGVSSALGTLAQRLGEALSSVLQAAQGAVSWVASLF
jgi:hypothetical protein